MKGKDFGSELVGELCLCGNVNKLIIFLLASKVSYTVCLFASFDWCKSKKIGHLGTVLGSIKEEIKFMGEQVYEFRYLCSTCLGER